MARITTRSMSACENPLNCFENASSQRQLPKRQLVAHTAQLDDEQPGEVLACRFLEQEYLIEASPERAIKHPFVVGRCDENALPSVGVQHLQERVDHPAQLAVFRGILALPADGVELVKHCDTPHARKECEDLPEVSRGLPQEGRHYRVEPDDKEGEAQLSRQGFGRAGLTAAGRAAEQEASQGPQSVAPKNIDPRLLQENLVEYAADPGVEHQIAQFTNGLARLKERRVALLVLWHLGTGPRPASSGGRRLSVKDALEIVGEEMVVLDPLLADDLFRDCAERGVVATNYCMRSQPQPAALRDTSYSSTRTGRITIACPANCRRRWIW